jgi:fimbrial chaperone protein
MRSSRHHPRPFSAAAWLAGIFLIFLLFAPSAAQAGNWRVIPIRLHFNRSTRSGVITVHNDDKTPLHLAVAADRWSEDAQGKDRYTATTDLIFFPQQLTIPPKKERVIRVGLKVPAIQQEKTYRLFLREIPGRPGLTDTGVAIAIRFGVPIFSSPLTDKRSLQVNRLTLKKGILGFSVKNTGNTHARITALHVSGKNPQGKETFSKTLNGWYLLAAATRPYTLKIPSKVCAELNALTVQVKTAHSDVSGTIHVDQADCHSR